MKISASIVKNWFQYKCDRKTTYESFEDLLEHMRIEETAAGSWATVGNDYERQIIQKLIQKEGTTNVLTPSADRDFVDAQRSRSFYQRTVLQRYGYQLVLWDTRTLRQTLKLPDNVRLSIGKPDLIYVTQHPEKNIPYFHVVDIKATQVTTAFHKAQVAYYALMLRSILQENLFPGEVYPVGEIWYFPSSSAPEAEIFRKEEFPIASYQSSVVDFFHRKIPTLIENQEQLKEGKDETFFHLYFKCEQCKYLPHCMNSIAPEKQVEQKDLSMVPGMSHESKRILWKKGIRNVGSFASQTEEQLTLQTEHANWVLKNHGKLLWMRAKALQNNQIYRMKELMTWLMPPRVDVAIFLIVDRDPIDGCLTTLSCTKMQDGQVNPPDIVIIDTQEEERQALQKILGQIHRYLQETDQHNEQHKAQPKQQLHAHLFVFEPAEAKDLQQALGRHLQHPEIQEQLLHLLRIFPPEELLPEPEYKGHHHLPATALRSVLEQLYAIPAPASYDLAHVSQALAQHATPPLACAYQPEKDFSRPFSSRLSIEICRRLKSPKDPSSPEFAKLKQRIRDDVEQRLRAMAALCAWLLQENRSAEVPFLRLNKQPFRFQVTLNPLNVGELDLLKVQTLLENRVNRLKALVELARPYQERVRRGKCFANLALLNNGLNQNGWALLKIPPRQEHVEILRESFGLILTDNHPDRLLDPTAWADYRLLQAREGYLPDSIFATIHKSVYNAEPFQELLKQTSRDGWFLDLCHVDINTDRLLDFLTSLVEPNQ